VPKTQGNGDDAERNLYWGAAFGVRTFLKKSGDCKEIAAATNPSEAIVERAVFRSTKSNVILVTDAYRGREIRKAIEDSFRSASGHNARIGGVIDEAGNHYELPAEADLVVYVGHDGLMDFQLGQTFAGTGGGKRRAIILACASKLFFELGLRPTGAKPLLWTTGLMASEVYTLKAALDGWMLGESDQQVRLRAAAAYAKYQNVSDKAAQRLFATGW
jgi:hypothetical protein